MSLRWSQRNAECKKLCGENGLASATTEMRVDLQRERPRRHVRHTGVGRLGPHLKTNREHGEPTYRTVGEAGTWAGHAMLFWSFLVWGSPDDGTVIAFGTVSFRDTH